MKDAELQRLAKQTGIDINQIAQWHFIHGPRFTSSTSGRPRKQERPKGMLAIKDIVRQYGVTYLIVQEWRQAGLKTQRKGLMVLVKDSDLKRWMSEHPLIRRRRGRPRGS